MQIIGPEIEPRLDWLALTDALAQGHELPRAEIADSFLYRGKDTLLTRSAWIDGLGMAVKPATIFPDNPGRGVPAVNGAVALLDDATGQLRALVDFHLVTKWKTAGDSLLSARRLARTDARRVLVIGAGAVAESMVHAYRALIPDAQVCIWSRSPAGAEALAQRLSATAVRDLEPAVRDAEIIATATMATQPVLRGEWLSPGTHVDLIGAYKADMREADDALVAHASLFVDSRATTLGHIGELIMPIAAGVITAESVRGDFYDLVRPDARRRQSDDEITLFKNGGGAHLDLMIAAWIGRVMIA